MTKNINLNNKNLNQVSNAPYLGVQLDNSLKWDYHVDKLCKKLSSKLFLLNRLRKFMDKNSLLLLYHSNIQPIMDYAISIWGYSSEFDKALITRLQHKAARIVCGKFNYIDFRGGDLANQLGL